MTTDEDLADCIEEIAQKAQDGEIKVDNMRLRDEEDRTGGQLILHYEDGQSGQEIEDSFDKFYEK